MKPTIRVKKILQGGTAVFLQDILDKAGLKTDTISIRGGGVYGIHEILAMGEGEVISIKHTALSRLVFAQGAGCFGKVDK